MRHRKSGRHLNRTSSHRKAMLSNMSVSLIEHESIKTTVIKAKELRRFVEPLITLGKNDSVANRRRAFAKLRSKSAVGKLFSELGPRYQERPGGYTRILKAGFRQGDASGIAYMQLVDAQLKVKERPIADLMADEELEAETVEEETLTETEVETESSASETESSPDSEAQATAEEAVVESVEESEVESQEEAAVEDSPVSETETEVSNSDEIADAVAEEPDTYPPSSESEPKSEDSKKDPQT